MNKGLIVNEVKEIFIYFYVYVGFFCVLNGINIFIRVIEECKVWGIIDKIGIEVIFVFDNYNVNIVGYKICNDLVGRDILNCIIGYVVFVLIIDIFFVEYLFVDIFYWDVLSVKDRELVIISMLLVMIGVEV